MSMEQPSQPKQEKPKTFPEEVEALQFHIHELAGEVNGKLDNLSESRVQELATTAIGQAQLLKLLALTDDFNRKAMRFMAGVAFGDTMTHLSGVIDTETAYGIALTGVMGMLTAAAIKSHHFVKKARPIVESLKSNDHA